MAADIRDTRSLFEKIDEDGHHEICSLCGEGGLILLCDSCEKVFHEGCILGASKPVNGKDWWCPPCVGIPLPADAAFSLWQQIREAERARRSSRRVSGAGARASAAAGAGGSAAGAGASAGARSSVGSDSGAGAGAGGDTASSSSVKHAVSLLKRAPAFVTPVPAAATVTSAAASKLNVFSATAECVAVSAPSEDFRAPPSQQPLCAAPCASGNVWLWDGKTSVYIPPSWELLGVLMSAAPAGAAAAARVFGAIAVKGIAARNAVWVKHWGVNPKKSTRAPSVDLVDVEKRLWMRELAILSNLRRAEESPPTTTTHGVKRGRPQKNSASEQKDGVVRSASGDGAADDGGASLLHARLFLRRPRDAPPSTLGEDGHFFYCAGCTDGGNKLVLCEACPRVLHAQCVPGLRGKIPNYAWVCPVCEVSGRGYDAAEINAAYAPRAAPGGSVARRGGKGLAAVLSSPPEDATVSTALVTLRRLAWNQLLRSTFVCGHLFVPPRSSPFLMPWDVPPTADDAIVSPPGAVTTDGLPAITTSVVVPSRYRNFGWCEGRRERFSIDTPRHAVIPLASPLAVSFAAKRDGERSRSGGGDVRSDILSSAIVGAGGVAGSLGIGGGAAGTSARDLRAARLLQSRGPSVKRPRQSSEGACESDAPTAAAPQPPPLPLSPMKAEEQHAHGGDGFDGDGILSDMESVASVSAPFNPLRGDDGDGSDLLSGLDSALLTSPVKTADLASSFLPSLEETSDVDMMPSAHAHSSALPAAALADDETVVVHGFRVNRSLLRNPHVEASCCQMCGGGALAGAAAAAASVAPTDGGVSGGLECMGSLGLSILVKCPVCDASAHPACDPDLRVEWELAIAADQGAQAAGASSHAGSRVPVPTAYSAPAFIGASCGACALRVRALRALDAALAATRLEIDELVSQARGEAITVERVVKDLAPTLSALAISRTIWFAVSPSALGFDSSRLLFLPPASDATSAAGGPATYGLAVTLRHLSFAAVLDRFTCAAYGLPSCSTLRSRRTTAGADGAESGDDASASRWESRGVLAGDGELPSLVSGAILHAGIDSFARDMAYLLSNPIVLASCRDHLPAAFVFGGAALKSRCSAANSIALPVFGAFEASLADAFAVLLAVVTTVAPTRVSLDTASAVAVPVVRRLEAWAEDVIGSALTDMATLHDRVRTLAQRELPQDDDDELFGQEDPVDESESPSAKVLQVRTILPALEMTASDGTPLRVRFALSLPQTAASSQWIAMLHAETEALDDVVVAAPGAAALGAGEDPDDIRSHLVTHPNEHDWLMTAALRDVGYSLDAARQTSATMRGILRAIGTTNTPVGIAARAVTEFADRQCNALDDVLLTLLFPGVVTATLGPQLQPGVGFVSLTPEANGEITLAPIHAEKLATTRTDEANPTEGRSSQSQIPSPRAAILATSARLAPPRSSSLLTCAELTPGATATFIGDPLRCDGCRFGWRHTCAFSSSKCALLADGSVMPLGADHAVISDITSAPLPSSHAQQLLAVASAQASAAHSDGCADIAHDSIERAPLAALRSAVLSVIATHGHYLVAAGSSASRSDEFAVSPPPGVSRRPLSKVDAAALASLFVQLSILPGHVVQALLPRLASMTAAAPAEQLSIPALLELIWCESLQTTLSLASSAANTDFLALLTSSSLVAAPSLAAATPPESTEAVEVIARCLDEAVPQAALRSLEFIELLPPGLMRLMREAITSLDAQAHGGSASQAASAPIAMPHVTLREALRITPSNEDAFFSVLSLRQVANAAARTSGNALDAHRGTAALLGALRHWRRVHAFPDASLPGLHFSAGVGDQRLLARDAFIYPAMGAARLEAIDEWRARRAAVAGLRLGAASQRALTDPSSVVQPAPPSDFLRPSVKLTAVRSLAPRWTGNVQGAAALAARCLWQASHLTLGRSRIDGTGVFSSVDIEVEDVIAEYTGEIIGDAVCDAREDYYRR